MMVLRAALPPAATGRGRGGRGVPSPPRAREELDVMAKDYSEVDVPIRNTESPGLRGCD
ncbi:hypothetical protein ACFV4Q_20220 [Streptomyces nojiriensis]|uniref:hypothetical protein n=1 Tax=Streptomyces nojiriensis TaxID=66374 RepID=UPI00364E5CFE